MGTRFCMYCGRQLADGEVCSCPQSAAARNNTQNGTASGANETHSSESAHKEAFSGEKKYKSSRFRNSWDNMRRNVRAQTRGQNPFKSFFSLFGQCILDPVYLASNAGRLPIPTIAVMAAVQGVILSVVLLLASGIAGRGLIRILTSIIGLHGFSGIRAVWTLAICGIGGALAYMAALALLAFLLYAVGRWILRRAAEFWETASAVVVCGIPMMIIGLFGIVFTLFSSQTLIILLLCGFILEFVLLYEAMKSLWGEPPSKTLYITAIVLFFLLCICYNIFRIFI